MGIDLYGPLNSIILIMKAQEWSLFQVSVGGSAASNQDFCFKEGSTMNPSILQNTSGDYSGYLYHHFYLQCALLNLKLRLT